MIKKNVVGKYALSQVSAESEKKMILRKALTIGEKSRLVKNFDAKANLQKLHEKFL